MSELLPVAKGEVRPALRDRDVARRAKKLFDDTRMAGMKVDASMALAGHIMQAAVELDTKRQAIAGSDPILNQLLIEIEATAIRQAQAIQSNISNGWGL